MERSAFTEGGTRLAFQHFHSDINAVPTASYRDLQGIYAMPSRYNNQEQPIVEQPTDAIALLKANHQRVRDLFALYEATRNPETERTLATQVFLELEIHAQLEENVFSPAVNEETEEGPALVKERREEHQTMKQLMQELRGMAHDTDAFDTTFQELMANVEHHVQEAEAAMFPLAEQELSEDLAEMREEMQELKADLQGA
jgi:hemerythrin-like domain-containing protein